MTTRNPAPTKTLVKRAAKTAKALKALEPPKPTRVIAQLAPGELKKLIDAEVGKYMDLVWYARADKFNETIEESLLRVEGRYPEPVARLSGKDSDWEHGFNSGCLAMARLLSAALVSHEAFADAKDSFPELDI